MDSSNLRNTKRVNKSPSGGKAKVLLFGEYNGASRAEEVEDPYYDGQDGFEKAYEQALRFSRNFLEEVRESQGELKN